MPKGDVLFLTLKIFSATGGIEKVCKIAGKALYEMSVEIGAKFSVNSMYDHQYEIDEKYFPLANFRGFGQSKMSFTFNSIKKGIKCNYVLISHVNLLPVGYFIKLLSPKTKLLLFAHGIEVWKPLSKFKKKLFAAFDLILSVSCFTKEKMIIVQNADPAKCVVLNNCLDPYLPTPVDMEVKEKIRAKYRLQKNNIVLLTLSRLSAHDRNKGYDKVLIAIKHLSAEFPNLKYLIAGKYQAAEKEWLDTLITDLELESIVVFTGYVADNELPNLFGATDVYVMPSIKEGFGIVFIEAMYYGLPVIGGNKDGSVDALRDGEFGILINPDDQQELIAAIKNVITNPSLYIPDHHRLVETFSYSVYKNQLQMLLSQVA